MLGVRKRHNLSFDVKYLCKTIVDRQYLCLGSRLPHSTYTCTCVEGCFGKKEVICTINKDNRNLCKYCRYMKCKNSAGMVEKWVLSAYMPEAEKKKIISKTKQSTNVVSNNDTNLCKLELQKIQDMIDETILQGTLTDLIDKEVNQTKYLFILYYLLE